MKQQLNKMQNFIKKNKIPTLVVGLILLVGVVVLIGRSVADPNTGYLRNQLVDGLSFENATLVHKDGITTFTAEVYNENGVVYQLKNVSINLTDESGNETTLVGYIGENLEINEGKIITASIDDDLSDSVSLEYVINK